MIQQGKVASDVARKMELAAKLAAKKSKYGPRLLRAWDLREVEYLAYLSLRRLAFYLSRRELVRTSDIFYRDIRRCTDGLICVHPGTWATYEKRVADRLIAEGKLPASFQKHAATADSLIFRLVR